MTDVRSRRGGPMGARRTSRRTRRGAALVAVAAAALVIAAGIVVVSRATEDTPAGSQARSRIVYRVGREASPPGSEVAWWAPVHGEPLGIALDGDVVAVSALDEVRLLGVRDGALRWVAPVRGVRTYRPAVGADRVVATSESAVVLLRRADGAVVASVPFAGPGPAAILSAGAEPATVVAASESGAMLALDATSGTVRWAVEHPGEVLVAPQADVGVVVASWNDDLGATLRAFDLLTGALRWEHRTDALTSAPLVVGGRVVVADGPSPRVGRVRSLDVRTGQVRWEVPLAGWFDPYLEPATDAQAAFLVDGVGTVVAVDLATGALRWRQETGFDVLHRGVALTAATVVFPTFDDVLVVLDRATGRWRSADPASGVPIDIAGAGDRLVSALRLGAPSRVEARSGF